MVDAHDPVTEDAKRMLDLTKTTRSSLINYFFVTDTTSIELVEGMKVVDGHEPPRNGEAIPPPSHKQPIIGLENAYRLARLPYLGLRHTRGQAYRLVHVAVTEVVYGAPRQGLLVGYGLKSLSSGHAWQSQSMLLFSSKL